MPSYYDDYQHSSYDRWASAETYTHSPGVVVLPIAEDPPTNPDELREWSPCVVVHAFAPMRMRTTEWTAEKQRTPPVIPRPASAGKAVFVGGEINIPAPKTATSLNSVIWEASGSYTYVENCRDAPEQDGYILMTQPWTTPKQGENSLLGSPPSGSTLQGALTEAGADVRIGVLQMSSYSPTNPLAVYDTVTWYPGQFLNSELVNGGPVLPVSL